MRHAEFILKCIVHRADLPPIISLLQRVQRGDHSAFEGLYVKTAPTYFSIARQCLSDGKRAEKLLEDFYVKLARDVTLQQSVLDQLTTASQYMRANAGRRGFMCDDNHTIQRGWAQRRHRHNMVSNPGPHITKAQRALYLRLFFGLTHDEIAEQLGYSACQVPRLLREAPKKLTDQSGQIARPPS